MPIVRSACMFTPALLLTFVLAACSDDGGEGGSEGSESSSEATSDSGSSETQDTSSSETGDSSETTGVTGEGLVCGELECGPGEVCLNFPQAPNCTDKPEDEPCPEGTEETLCGGAGFPCCCEPTPPPIFECVEPPGGCAPVDCACLAELCVPTCSMTGTPEVFICEEPPAP